MIPRPELDSGSFDIGLIVTISVGIGFNPDLKNLTDEFMRL